MPLPRNTLPRPVTRGRTLACAPASRRLSTLSLGKADSAGSVRLASNWWSGTAVGVSLHTLHTMHHLEPAHGAQLGMLQAILQVGSEQGRGRMRRVNGRQPALVKVDVPAIHGRSSARLGSMTTSGHFSAIALTTSALAKLAGKTVCAV